LDQSATAVASFDQVFIDEPQIFLGDDKVGVTYEILCEAVFECLIKVLVFESELAADVDDAVDDLDGVDAVPAHVGFEGGFEYFQHVFDVCGLFVDSFGEVVEEETQVGGVDRVAGRELELADVGQQFRFDLDVVAVDLVHDFYDGVDLVFDQPFAGVVLGAAPFQEEFHVVFYDFRLLFGLGGFGLVGGVGFAQGD
jgi:hypothetical protein